MSLETNARSTETSDSSGHASMAIEIDTVCYAMSKRDCLCFELNHSTNKMIVSSYEPHPFPFHVNKDNALQVSITDSGLRFSRLVASHI